MLKFLLLCLGSTGLMALSQRENPWRYCGSRIEDDSRQGVDCYLLLGIVWMTCFAFLRTSYNDTEGYIGGFLNAPPLREGFAAGTYLRWAEDPLAYFYRDLMRGITGNYHVYFLLPALLHSIVVMKFLKQYSVNPAVSLLIFFCLGTYAMMFLAALKQGMAMIILLLALPYARDGKYAAYVLLVLLASLFHFYAVIYLAVPFLFGKPWGKTTWITVGITAAAFVTYRATFTAVTEYVEAMGGRIAVRELFDGNSVHPFRVAVYWVPGVLALVFRRYVNHNSTGMENLFVNMSVLCACVLSMGLVEGANLFGRMASYLEIGIAVSVPCIIRKIFDERSERTVDALAVLMFLGYFCYEFAVSKNFGAEYRAISLEQFVLELLGLR